MFPSTIPDNPLGYDATGCPRGQYIVTSGGFFYVFLRQGASFIGTDGDMHFHAFKSPDGLTWTEQDAANAPLTFNGTSGPDTTGTPGWQGFTTCCQDGSLVYFVDITAVVSGLSNVATGVQILAYDLSTDTWGTFVATITPLPGAPTVSFRSCSLKLIRRGAGDLLLIYNGPLETVGIERRRIYLATWNGSVWGAPVAFPSQAGSAISWDLCDATCDSGGFSHSVFLGSAGLFHQSYSAGGAFGTRQLIAPAADLFFVADPSPISDIIQFGTFIGVVAETNPSSDHGELTIYYANAGVADPVWSSALITTDGPQQSAQQYTSKLIALAVKGSTLYCLWLQNDNGSRAPANGRLLFATADVTDPTTWSVAATLLANTQGVNWAGEQALAYSSGTGLAALLSSANLDNEFEEVANFSFVAGSVTPLDITCDDPPDGQVGVVYSHAFPATGGTEPYSFAITAGSLPPGLTLDPATGVVSGTPTTAGNYPFTIQVTDADDNTASVDCSITIASDIAIECGDPPDGQVLVFYSHTFPVTGGVPPYTFAITGGALPPGLTLDGSTGVISGVPINPAGTYSFTVTVTDADGNTDSVTCSILIAAADEPGTGGHRPLAAGNIPGHACRRKNWWDECLEQEIRMYRRITFPKLCSIPEEYRNLLPWDDTFGAIPPQAVTFQKMLGIATPAPAAGDQEILSLRVPSGWDGLVSGFFFQYSGTGFAQGSGDIRFRIQVNQYYLKDLCNCPYLVGESKQPVPMTQGAIVGSDARLRVLVNVPNLSGLIQVGQSTVSAGLLGFFWPR